MKAKTALIIPDTHIDFHDTRAFNLMLKAVKAEFPKLDEVVLLGDFGEFQTVSRHPKDPTLSQFLQDEFDAVNKELDRIDKCFPKAKKVYIEGNHEDRLKRYLWDHAKVFTGMISCEKALLAHRSNWKWIPYAKRQKHFVLGSKLIARHCPMGGGEHSAAATVKKAKHSIIFGHTHRIQEFQTVGINGDIHRGMSAGWLGDVNHSIFDYQDNPQYALGFAVVHVLPDKTFFNSMVHIIDYKCCVNGTIYEG